MAETQILKFTGEVDSDKKKGNNYTVKTATTYTELEAKLTHNFIGTMQLFTASYAEKFQFLFRGKFTRAIGDGIRFIQTYGSQQVGEHRPVTPYEKICLEAPNNLQERSEILKNYFRLKCAASAPDLLASADIGANPDEMYEFQQKKVGDVRSSLELYLYLMWHYVLITDPWAKEHADFLLSYGVMTRLGTKWEDNDRIGEALQLIKEKIQQEYEKEKNMKNIVTYSLVEWLPRKLIDSEKNKKRKNKPTAAITKNNLVKMYFTNKDVDPVEYVNALARAILYHANRMFTWTSENDSAFPGNNKDSLKLYGKDKANFQYFCTCDPNDFIIIMNDQLFLTLKEFQGLSPINEKGTFIGFVHQLMQFRIIPMESMPYGCIKMGSKLRYNQGLLYDKILTDTMGGRDFRMWTLHQGVLVGIREHVPFCCLRINDLYVNPPTAEKMFDMPAADNI